MTDFTKVLRIGTRPSFKGSKRYISIFVKIEYKGGRLSISGVEGPTRGGNASGSCGQIDMHYEHRNPADNDPRNKAMINGSEYDVTVYANTIRFAKGWYKELWWNLLDMWKRWHLNDMRAECEHQRALGWTYNTHHDHVMDVMTDETVPTEDPLKMKVGTRRTSPGECPVCGYKIGSAWLQEEVPNDVLVWLKGLPDADKQPAWI